MEDYKKTKYRQRDRQLYNKTVINEWYNPIKKDKREIIVIHLSYNSNNFFFSWSTIGSVFLHVGLKYPMIDLKKKLLVVHVKVYGPYSPSKDAFGKGDT
jgi:hypothetical protein